MPLGEGPAIAPPTRNAHALPLSRPQARKRGQLNANFVAAAAAGSGYGSDDEGVRRMAAAVDAATGAPGAGYDSDDAGERSAVDF